ncbi:MAG: hypothetical protein AAGF92_12320 [Myxococcota bacterium]
MRSLSALLPFALLLLLPVASGCSEDENASSEPLPGVEGWAPVGARTVGTYSYDIIPEPDAFRTMHVAPNNSDNVWVALAPQLELDWVAEPSFYIPEGPTYDNVGNLYFSPLFPNEDVSLVSLDAETGERNWAIEGDGLNAGSGAILVLNDPDNPGEQIIYHATFTEVMAIRPDGTEVWRSPTGLELPPIVEGERLPAHSYGFNYHAPTDSVVGLTSGADIFAFDRATGDLVAAPTKVPGAPAAMADVELPQFIVDQSNALTDEVFGVLPGGLSFFSVIVDTIFGGGSVVTNYFAIDPNTGRIYVAATADDAADGTEDGISELGAVYSLQLVDDGNGGFEFRVLNSASFEGGTGSTPTVSEDGERLFVSDELGNVIALDSDLNELWRFDVGEPVAASIAVSPDNREIYAVTQTDVFKLIDDGDSATLEWMATFGAFEDDPNIEVEFQALTPTITANGVAVSIGGGRTITDPISGASREIMLAVGIGLLDRETGELLAFAEGREESIAVTSVASDGGVYTAGSPVRRVSGKALFPDETDDVIGGISRYKPVRNDLLVRDAVCAAAARALNASTIAENAPASAEEDVRQIRVLLTQGQAALARAVAEATFADEEAENVRTAIADAAVDLSTETLESAGRSLFSLCESLRAADE